MLLDRGELPLALLLPLLFFKAAILSAKDAPAGRPVGFLGVEVVVVVVLMAAELLLLLLGIVIVELSPPLLKSFALVELAVSLATSANESVVYCC